MDTELENTLRMTNSRPHPILLSIKPEFAHSILSGTKTIEIRRRRPGVYPGSLVYLYASSPLRCLIGVFRVKDILTQPIRALWQSIKEGAVITQSQFEEYVKGLSCAHAILIENVHQLIEPISLEQLRHLWPGFHPPQSYRYLTPENQGAVRLMHRVKQTLTI